MVYFSWGTLPPKKGKRAPLGDLADASVMGSLHATRGTMLAEMPIVHGRPLKVASNQRIVLALRAVGA